MAKYNEQLVETLCGYLREGDCQKLACKKVGIGESTFHDWVHAKPEFAERIKKAKDDFQGTITAKLEATLWKRAMGYDVEETETEYINDGKGNPRIKGQKTKTKHILPDTGALIFALTNIAPDRWINRQRLDTKDVKQEEKPHRYCFEDLPKDVLFGLADKLQEQEYQQKKNEKEGA